MLGARILVVDDSEPLRRVVARALTRNGYEVTTASTGREALTSFEAERPDAVVLDLDLPELPGWEVCRLLRKRSTVPIIIMTGDMELQLATQHATRQAQAHLQKPFMLERLLETLQRALERAQAAQRNMQTTAIASGTS